MASISRHRHRYCILMACFCWLISCCKSDQSAVATPTGAFHTQKKDTADIVGRAVVCFNDRYIYSGCQGSLRLGPQGTFDVPPEATDTFCGGPCLAETDLVLHCINGIMNNFRFYNGASIGDVQFALDRGCGHAGGRGDFGVLGHLEGGGYYGDYYYYNRGDKIAVPVKPLLYWSSVVALLLWVN